MNHCQELRTARSAISRRDLILPFLKLVTTPLDNVWQTDEIAEIAWLQIGRLAMNYRPQVIK